MQEINVETVELSLVIPVYNEKENIKPLLDKINKDLDDLGKTFEIIFVDDGSTDGTFSVLEDSQKEYENLKAIRFRRNCGKSAALSAGFFKSRGEIIVTLDGDGQDDPGEIKNLSAHDKKTYKIMSARLERLIKNIRGRGKRLPFPNMEGFARSDKSFLEDIRALGYLGGE